jgi:hypothetical protein
LPPCINIFEEISLIIFKGSCIVVYFNGSEFNEVVADLMDTLVQEITSVIAGRNVDLAGINNEILWIKIKIMRNLKSKILM